MKVGRAPLDPDTIQLIEQQNPEVAFDWPRLLKGEAVPEARPRAESVRPGKSDRRPAASPPRRPEPDAVGPETSAAAARPEPPPPAPDTPAGRRLGDEGHARLRTRYLELAARLDEKVEDAARRAELKAETERLNPDAWTTDEAVTQGLEQYEAVHEALRAVVGRRRRRSRPASA